MTQTNQPHRFKNDQGNAWCQHCGLSEAAHDLQAEQPSRSEGAELDLDEIEKQYISIPHYEERYAFADGHFGLLLEALRQAKLQATAHERCADDFVYWQQQYGTLIDQRDQLLDELDQAMHQAEHATEDEWKTRQAWQHRLDDVIRLQAELAAANERIDVLNHAWAGERNDVAELEEQVRERDQTIADLQRKLLRPIYRLSMVQDLTKQKEALEAENEQLRASLEAAKANNGG